jgi:hypothetical protein
LKSSVLNPDLNSNTVNTLNTTQTPEYTFNAKNENVKGPFGNKKLGLKTGFFTQIVSSSSNSVTMNKIFKIFHLCQFPLLNGVVKQVSVFVLGELVRQKRKHLHGTYSIHI